MNPELINIMLVEDDDVDIMNVKRAFKKHHINNPLFVANNGREALDMLRGINVPKITPQPKIILLDINMPRMNGLEFLREIRSDPALKHISVFIMTTSDNDSDIIYAHELNVSGYILKPLSFQKFVDAVSALKSYWQLIEFPNE